MKEIIEEVYKNGVTAVIEKIKDRFTRRSAKYRCNRCKRYEFHTMYWSCLECEFCCHLMNLYIHEKTGKGILVAAMDREISNLFTRHFKEQIKNAKKDKQVTSEDFLQEMKIVVPKSIRGKVHA